MTTTEGECLRCKKYAVRSPFSPFCQACDARFHLTIDTLIAFSKRAGRHITVRHIPRGFLIPPPSDSLPRRWDGIGTMDAEIDALFPAASYVPADGAEGPQRTRLIEEIMERKRQGQPSAIIAMHLGLSQRTVEEYVTRSYRISPDQRPQPKTRKGR